MPTVERASGVRVTVPDGVTVVEPMAPRRGGRRDTRRQPRDVPDAAPSQESQALLEAFALQNMDLVDAIPLAAEAAPSTGRRRAAPAEADVEVPLSPREDAVVLLEQDGVFSWEYQAEELAAPTAVRRGPAEPRRVRFRIPLAAEAPADAARPVRRWIIRDFIVGKVKAYVLKFAARVAVGSAMTWLERNVRRCLIGSISWIARRPAARHCGNCGLWPSWRAAETPTRGECCGNWQAERPDFD